MGRFGRSCWCCRGMNGDWDSEVVDVRLRLVAVRMDLLACWSEYFRCLPACLLACLQ